MGRAHSQPDPKVVVTERYNHPVGSDRFVPYQRRRGYPLNSVPEPHMRNLHRRAHSKHTSLTNVAGEIFARRYGILFSPSRRGPREQDSNDLHLRLPVDVLDAVREEAEGRNVTIRTVMLDAISDEFRLKRPAPTTVEPGKIPGRPRERTPA
jgi:hypothetical protein